MVVPRLGRCSPGSGRVHRATFWSFVSTVFHHAAPTLAIRAVSISMIQATVFAALVTKTALAETAPSRVRPTLERAIPVATVTPPAKEEDLEAPGRRTDHEPKRLHVPNGGTGENLVDRRGS